MNILRIFRALKNLIKSWLAIVFQAIYLHFIIMHHDKKKLLRYKRGTILI